MKNKEQPDHAFSELADDMLDNVSGGTEAEIVPGVAETFGDIGSTGVGGRNA